MVPELPTGFWGGWILVVTLVSLAAIIWLSISIYTTPEVDPAKQQEEPVWDNDLREGSKAPPLWWFWLLLGATVFSLVYLMLYPGLGFWSGTLNWSQGSRVAESYENFENEFSDVRAQISAMSLAEIQGDNNLMQTAERVYKRECSACHGPEARGQASLFPNLMDVDWQWGASPESIEQTIRNGRNALMPPWEAALGEEQINQVVEFVALLNEGDNEDHPGKVAYDAFCVACHGADGTGNTILGAPNLTDQIWLYGGGIDAISESVRNGRTGIMPAFAGRLDDTQIHLLVALLAR